MYKVAYWDGYNAVPPDAEMEDAFQAIARENKQHGVDMKFWRRYQPYKSHPEYLVRDSILCQQGALTEEGVPVLNKSHEDKLLKPKYPGLDRTLNSKHFVLHHVSGDSAQAREIASVLERNYDRVLADFGMAALTAPVHAEIYPDIEHYHFAIGQPDAPDSDAGMAVDDNRFKMVSPANPGSYHTRESLLKGVVHEFAHCVHYQFLDRLSERDRQRIGDGREAPWLFEAMACYAAGQFYDPRKFEYLRNGQYPSIAELNGVEKNGKVYDLGYVLIKFIAETWGKEKVLELLRVNGNIPATLGLSDTEFERSFYAYLQRAY